VSRLAGRLARLERHTAGEDVWQERIAEAAAGWNAPPAAIAPHVARLRREPGPADHRARHAAQQRDHHRQARWTLRFIRAAELTCPTVEHMARDVAASLAADTPAQAEADRALLAAWHVYEAVSGRVPVAREENVCLRTIDTIARRQAAGEPLINQHSAFVEAEIAAWFVLELPVALLREAYGGGVEEQE
jgi:hypothetical protein